VAACLALTAAGCTENTAPGNDREAELEPPPTAASMAPVQSALSGVATGLLKPQIMNEADLGAIAGAEAGCRFTMTRVGFPVFVYPMEGAGPGVIKLNGRLISLPAEGQGRYASSGLSVEVRPLEGASPGRELFDAEFVVRLPGAEHELGFHGYSECSAETPAGG
jgi:hypothetical protein